MNREGPDDQRGKRLPKASLWMAAGLTVGLVALPLVVIKFERALAEKRVADAFERLGAGAAEVPAPKRGAGATNGVFVLAALAAIDEPWDYTTLDSSHSFPGLAFELEAAGRNVAAGLLANLEPCASEFGGTPEMWEPFWNPEFERTPVARPNRVRCERHVLETQRALCEPWTLAAEDICNFTWFDTDWLQATPKFLEMGVLSGGPAHLAPGLGALGYTSTPVIGGFFGGPAESWPPLRSRAGPQGRGIQGAAVGFGVRARLAALDGDAAGAALELERSACLAALFADDSGEDAGRYWGLLTGMLLNDLESVLYELPPGAEFEVLAARLSAVDVRKQLALRWQGARSTVLAGVRADQMQSEDFQPGKAAALLEWVERFGPSLELPSSELLEAFASSGMSAFELATHDDESVRLEAEFEHTVAELLRLEAGVLLARTALVGRAHGKEAAETFAASLLDPFDSLPLRTRIQADGSLLIWSVGRDGIDDGGMVARSGAHGGDHSWVVR